MAINPSHERDTTLRSRVDQLNRDDITAVELLAFAQREGLVCCALGCGSGACETCACCSAGWCVMGYDGLPEHPQDRKRWLEVAAEYNPIAAELARVCAS